MTNDTKKVSHRRIKDKRALRSRKPKPKNEPIIQEAEAIEAGR